MSQTGIALGSWHPRELTRRTSQPAAFFTRDRRRMREQEKRLRYSKPETQQGWSRALLRRQVVAQAVVARQIPKQVQNELHDAVPRPGEP